MESPPGMKSWSTLHGCRIARLLSGRSYVFLHTPGHTPGSMSIIVDDEIALVGDAMSGIFKGSIFPPFALDVRQMIQSWGKLLQTDCYLFMPSHGSANSRELVQKEHEKWLKILK